jgi:molybdenum cofactor guanylyltransferase
MTTVGVILAGGRSSRMGTDKALVQIGGVTLLDRAISRLSPQVDALAINSNVAIADQRLPVLPDATADFDGPLAGILAGLTWARGLGAQHLASVAVDTPFFPLDLVRRMATIETSSIILARSGGRNHPVFGLWPIEAVSPLKEFLERGNTRRVMAFLDGYGYESVDFPDEPFDPFFNINTPQDLAAAIEMEASFS